MQADFPIDFVVTWVNNHDKVWQRKKFKYEQKQLKSRPELSTQVQHGYEAKY